MKILRLFLLWIVLSVAAPVFAQEGNAEPEINRYEEWQTLATEVETKLDNSEDFSTDDLENLRSQITAFRPDFSQARSINADRIQTLEAQLAALGPVPETGDELAEITEKRDEINAQLENLRAPVRVAEAAFQRAEGLISEIDNIIRERQARQLLSLGPSPVDVRTWPIALADMRRILRDGRNEISVPETEEDTNQFRDNLPIVIFLTFVSLPLIVRGRTWAGGAIEYMRTWGGRGSGVWSFLVSLLRIFLPLAGVYIFAYAMQIAGVFGPKIEKMLGLLPVFGFILLGFRWLAERLFPRNASDAIIQLSNEKRRAARFYIMLLSILFVMRGLAAVIFSVESAAPETSALVSFPLVVLIGLVLFFMGAMMRSAGEQTVEDVDDLQVRSGLNRVISVFGTTMMVVGVVAPLMAAVGYAEAGDALLYPTITSMLLLGLVVVLQRFCADVYGLITRQGTDVRDGLAAVLIGFVLTLLALPLLALIWGARVADLTELWTQFLQGFDVGGTQISPVSFMTFAIVFAIGYTVTRILQSTLRHSVLPKTRIDIGGQNALVSGTGYIGIFLAALIAITVAGLDLSGIAIVAGALSVGIGFGLQTIVSNFVSGIILLIERPISEGDWIEVGGQMGYVKDISVRATRIETFDRTDVIVPNSDLISGTVTNYTRGNTIGRLIVSVGVAYGTDTKRIDKILREIAEAHPMVMMNPPPNIIFSGFGADSLDFEIRVILRDVNWMLSVKNDMNHEIAARFEAEGIEIPFAQRDVWLRNPEALGGDAKQQT